MKSPLQKLEFRYLGIVDYLETWDAMKTFTLERQPDQCDEIWFLQHPPVFTLGQAGKPEHILNAHDVPVVNTDRGGQVTYHGPGQIIAYLLLDVRRRKLGIRDLVIMIENCLITLLDEYGIKADGRRDAPGVYVQSRKIAALGLRIRNGCSYHGLSLNVDMDLGPFSDINPCGYEGMEVTQMRDFECVPSHLSLSDIQARLAEILAASLVQLPNNQG